MNEQMQTGDSLVITVLDKNGNPKPVFQENKFFQYLIKHNVVSPKFPKIPLLLGRWQTHKELTWE